MWSEGKGFELGPCRRPWCPSPRWRRLNEGGQALGQRLPYPRNMQMEVGQKGRHGPKIQTGTSLAQKGDVHIGRNGWDYLGRWGRKRDDPELRPKKSRCLESGSGELTEKLGGEIREIRRGWCHGRQEGSTWSGLLCTVLRSM